VATIVNDKGNQGNESNGSKEGNEDDDDKKNGDDCNEDATNDVILDCAAGTLCKAPSGANLAESPHSCWGCNKKIHSSVLRGDSILNLLSNHPSFIGMSLNNERIIEQDDNNKTRALCFTCIAPLSGFPIAAHTVEARIASMLASPCPPPARLQLLGQLNCDWVSHCCVRKKETPGSCTLCNRPVHYECQLSWERYADLSHEKRLTSPVCREHHPEYQHWQKVHIKPVEEHEKEARAKEALNSFVWAREGEHEGAVVHQCQLLDRIAEFGQVWVKWASTGKIMCIPRSKIEVPSQGRERKRSVVVTHVEGIISKKQRKSKLTADAKSPVPIQK
jgi:hypothetical protein